MNSGFSDFQDLINTTTTGEDLQSLQDELKSLEEEVADNKIDINTNTAAISTNTTGIANNLSTIINNVNAINNNVNAINNNTLLIQVETARITTNQNNISINDQKITSNLQAIVTEASRIDTNVVNISTNISNINTNISNIATNISNIAINTATISTNSQDITTLNNTVLLKDGSVQLDPSFTPTNTYDLVSKDYVDSKVIPGNFLPLSGGTMLGHISMGNTYSILDAVLVQSSEFRGLLDSPVYFQYAKAIVGGFLYYNMIEFPDETKIEVNELIDMKTHDIDNVGHLNWSSSMNSINTTEFSTLSGVSSNIQSQFNTVNNNVNNNTSGVATNSNLILLNDGRIASNTTNINNNDSDIFVNATDIATNTSDILTNTGHISTNTSNISTNTGNISTNTSNISINTTNISTNTSNISTNTTNIASNSNAIPLKVSKSGDTMTGTLNFNYPNIYAEFGKNATNHVNGSGIIDYNIVNSTKHELVLRGGQSTLDTNTEKHARVDGYLQVDEALTVQGTLGNMNRGTSHGGVRQIKVLNTINPAASWQMGNQYNNPSTGDNDFYFEVTYTNGSSHQAGFIQDSATNIQMNFTGQHRSMSDFKFTEDKIGLIVEATGRYMNLITEEEECSQISCITINDSIPVVSICNEEKSKKVFGVISAEEEDDRIWQAGNFASIYYKVEGDHRLYINSIGEGGIWVCSKNGNLENGDYICAAGINGYGMKQTSENLTNYTVAKITMDCDFNPQLEEVKIWKNGGWIMTGEFKPAYECITLDDGLKIAFVGCTYHCG